MKTAFLLLVIALSVSAADWTDGLVTGIDTISGAEGVPAKAKCCIEYTFDSAAEQYWAVIFWYGDMPKLTLKIGEHVRLRRKRTGANDFEVQDDAGQTQMMLLTRSENR